MRIGTCPVVLNTIFFVRHETYFVKSICLGVSIVLLQELFVLWLRHSLTMYYINSYTKKTSNVLYNKNIQLLSLSNVEIIFLAY